METDPSKVVILKWPTPTTIKELRSLPGMIGYYRKCVHGYALLSKPLTDLLKKGAFMWSSKPQEAFDGLKKALSSAPI